MRQNSKGRPQKSSLKPEITALRLKSGLEYVALVAILLLAFYLRSIHLSKISFWYDEACSWRISQFAYTEMFDAISRDAHPPLYYILVNAWGTLFGFEPTHIRLLSVLAGTGVVAAAWWFGQIIAETQCVTDNQSHPDSPRTDDQASESSRHAYWAYFPLLIALLVAINPLQVELSHEARPYSLTTLFCILAGAFALRSLRFTDRFRDWFGFALFATAASLTHYYGLLTVVAIFLFAISYAIGETWSLGWKPAATRIWYGISMSGFFLQLVWTTWLPTFQFQCGRANRQLWMRALTWDEICNVCWKAIAGGKESSLWESWTWLAPIFWGTLFLVTLLQRTSTGHSKALARTLRLTGLCAGMPLIIAILYGYNVRNILGVRYLAFAQIYLFLAIALLFWNVRQYDVRLIACCGLICWSAYWCLEHVERRSFQANFSGIQGAIMHLEKNRDAREPVFVSSPFVQTMIQPYLNTRNGVCCRRYSDYRNNLLWGPPMQPQDFCDPGQMFSKNQETIWVVDVLGLFGRNSTVNVPNDYQMVSKEFFVEEYGNTATFVIKKFVKN